MGETVYIKRNERTGKAERAMDLVDSPDDGGYYFSEHDFVKSRSRVSKKVWPDRITALKAKREAIKWEPWH